MKKTSSGREMGVSGGHYGTDQGKNQADFHGKRRPAEE
jgi:hypothetical protein